MTFKIIIWKFVINFSILREEEPQEVESSVFYRLTKNEVRGIREGDKEQIHDDFSPVNLKFNKKGEIVKAPNGLT